MAAQHLLHGVASRLHVPCFWLSVNLPKLVAEASSDLKPPASPAHRARC